MMKLLIACLLIGAVAAQDYEAAVNAKLDAMHRFQMISATNAPNNSAKVPPLSVAMQCVIALVSLFFLGTLIEFALEVKEKSMEIVEKTKGPASCCGGGEGDADSSEPLKDGEGDKAFHTQAFEKMKALTHTMHQTINSSIEPVPMVAILIIFAHFRLKTDLGYTTDNYNKDAETAYMMLTAVIAITLCIGIMEMAGAMCCTAKGCETVQAVSVLVGTVAEFAGKVILISGSIWLIILIITTPKA